jgi:hypothetical protein
MQTERILDVFPAADEFHRLVLATAQSGAGEDLYFLRQETFAGDVGWFVQSRVSIEACQLAGLKAALTCGRVQQTAPRYERETLPAATILTFQPAAAS